MANNINMLNAWTNDDSITRAELQAGVENATVYDLAEANMAATSAVTFAGTGAPTAKVGKTWFDTNSLAASGGPTGVLKVWDSAANLGLFYTIYSASEPTSTYRINGVGWYDMTLQILRVWRSSAYDPHAIDNNSTGGAWHPVSEAYQLWKNENAGTIDANRVVIRGASGEYQMDTTALEKNQAVVGVTLESVATGVYGVVATVEGGARVDVYCDEATHAVAKGDGLVTSTTAGQARSVGALQAGGHPAQTQMIVGTPLGCFARAVGVTASNLAPCKLLGSVGTGARAYRTPASIRNYAVGTPATSLTATDFSLLASGTIGAQGSSTALIDAKHAPIAAADVEVAFTYAASGGTASLTITFSKDGASASRAYTKSQVDSGTDPDLVGRVALGLIPTSIGDGTAANNVVMGNKSFYSTTIANVSGTAALQILMPGYIY